MTTSSAGSSKDRVLIFDTTLRDGEQCPGATMTLEEKLEVADLLDAMGVDIIEAGFPIASNGDFEAVSLIASRVKNAVIAGLARAVSADIARAGEAVRHAARPRIHTFVSTSPIHLAHQMRKSEDEVVEIIVQTVTQARNLVEDVEWSGMDATRTPIDYLCRCVEAAIRAGATTINLPDTVGYATPDEYRAMFRAVRERVPDADKAVYSVHCHNDLGLAVANSLAGIEGGARQVECTINGIGERAGNAALEEIVMALHVRSDRMPHVTNVDTKQLYPSSDMLTQLTGQGVQVNKAIVGRNAFAHEAGIHQDGILKDRRTYEIMRAEDVGAPWNPLVLGKHSGRHAVQKRYKDLGFDLQGAELIEVYRTLMAIADDRKVLTDQDIRAAIGGLRSEHAPAAAAPHDAIDPFDTPSAAAHHPIHESGYGHGV